MEIPYEYHCSSFAYYIYSGYVAFDNRYISPIHTIQLTIRFLPVLFLLTNKKNKLNFVHRSWWLTLTSRIPTLYHNNTSFRLILDFSFLFCFFSRRIVLYKIDIQHVIFVDIKFIYFSFICCLRVYSNYPILYVDFHTLKRADTIVSNFHVILQPYYVLKNNDTIDQNYIYFLLASFLCSYNPHLFYSMSR